jgi:dolichol-phosphate mannosyltransferase
VIIIPTFNERDNLRRLLPALQRVCGSMDHEMHLLIVDDDSPDGTQIVVREHMRQMPRLHLITGRRRGLGAAYVRGMHHAMAGLRADAICEMDADLSHKPDDVPRLVAALQRGADFAIGSRYVTGGSIADEWGAFRRMISKLGNLVARHLVGIARIQDCTAGFRAIRASLLSQIDLPAINAQGYAFQVALLHEAVARGACVVEIPVVFVDRSAGASKLGFADILEFAGYALWSRARDSATVLKFGIVGASGVLVNLGLFALLLSAGMNKYLASPIAIEASIISNFFLNNYWTFRERETSDYLPARGFKFNVVALISLGLSYATFVVLSIAFPQGSPYLMQFAGIVPASLLNYFLNSRWTFRHRPAGARRR